MLNSGCIKKSRTQTIQFLSESCAIILDESVMWCYALCNHLYVQSYECRRLGDRVREQLRDVARIDKDASEPVARHYNLPTYSLQAARKAAQHQNKNLSSKSALLIPTLSTSAFHSTNLFLFSRHHIPTISVTPFSEYKPTKPTTPPIALTKG